MTSLVTVLDVESISFSRAIRGYNPDEVEEFLEKVADTLQYSAEHQVSLEQEINRLEEKLKEYENLKDSLQEALLMAQRGSEERLTSARREADALVAEAKNRAEALMADAKGRREDLLRQCEEARRTKENFLAEFRAMLTRFGSLLDGTRNDDGTVI